MGYRDIKTQLFDVRPRKSGGELDEERIAKIQRILDLAQKEILKFSAEKRDDFSSGRIINLRKQAAENSVVKPIPHKASNEKIKKAVRSQKDVSALLKEKGISYWPEAEVLKIEMLAEGEEDFSVARKNLLSVLSEIEGFEFSGGKKNEQETSRSYVLVPSVKPRRKSNYWETIVKSAGRIEKLTQDWPDPISADEILAALDEQVNGDPEIETLLEGEENETPAVIKEIAEAAQNEIAAESEAAQAETTNLVLAELPLVEEAETKINLLTQEEPSVAVALELATLPDETSSIFFAESPAVQESGMSETVLSDEPESQSIETIFQPPENIPIVDIEPMVQAVVLAAPEELGTVSVKSRAIRVRLFPRIAGFAAAGIFITLVIFGMSLAGRGLSAKDSILSSAMQAYQAMLAGKDSASRFDFGAAQVNFEIAYQNFLQADNDLGVMGRGLISVLEKLPGGSTVGSGAALLEAGEGMAQAGKSFTQIANLFLPSKVGDSFSNSQESLTQKIVQARNEIKTALGAVASANAALANVNIADLPQNMTEPVKSLKEKLPFVSQALTQLDSWSGVFAQILGHERAKKYLLIFQNNSEARPTGGFIGSYGILDLDEGKVKNLRVSNIYDLDGQLYEKVVPPQPIQKISTAWSTHDANWFADFPTSAKKIMWFYEKAGGETVDGVISLTPTVVERLLAVTGPIELPEYSVVLDQNNFIDITQHNVEVDFAKAQNQPKKILDDFAPKLLDKLWQVWPEKYQQILQVFADSLKEKHILFYFSNADLEAVFKEQGWGGEILSTDKDYLAVINTNINGFKTDKVIEQEIYHQAEAQADGTVIDTVKIVRQHLGGKSQYDWYNRVNADYLRVYVPLGSKLLSVKGQTLEYNEPPINYETANFKRDSNIEAEEKNMVIDDNSGTQILEESGKTVFGNWTYVSPGETLEITYKYRLPFKFDLSARDLSYSLLAQKQSGSLSSAFESVLRLPDNFKIQWQYPPNLQISGSQIKFTDELKTDKFYGIVFGR